MSRQIPLNQLPESIRGEIKSNRERSYRNKKYINTIKNSWPNNNTRTGSKIFRKINRKVDNVLKKESSYEDIYNQAYNKVMKKIAANLTM